ncbi:MAG: YeeE/YedE family protein [Prolixibacteraceae bacterium]|nr:YeeE/YedE family protein [Prolixibacteraceae bacterium]
MDNSKKYWNPYVGGIFLGLVLVAAFYFSGRGLGASGAVKSVTMATVETVAPKYAETAPYYISHSEQSQGGPLNNWLVLEMMGVLVGGFLSGALSGRLKLKVEHQPKITSKTRIIFAVIGGVLFGFGSQIGRGCTSGSALTGMAVMSVGGFITMAFIFGTAFALAYFFRKLWI